MKDTKCIETKCEYFTPKEIAGIGGSPMGSGRCKLVWKGLRKLKSCPLEYRIPINIEAIAGLPETPPQS